MVTQKAEPNWLKRAREDMLVGVRKTPAIPLDERITEMYAAVGRGEVEPDCVSWSAACVGTWLKESNREFPSPGIALDAIAYETLGRPIRKFRPGAICVFYYSRNREKDWRRHVAIGVREGHSYYDCIGVQKGYRIAMQRFPKRDLTAMRWPTRGFGRVAQLASAGAVVVLVTMMLTFSTTLSFERSSAADVCRGKIALVQRSHNMEISRIAALANAECTVTPFPLTQIDAGDKRKARPAPR